MDIQGRAERVVQVLHAPIKVKDFFPCADVRILQRISHNHYQYPQNELPYLIAVLHSDKSGMLGVVGKLDIRFDGNDYEVTFRHNYDEPQEHWMPSLKSHAGAA